MVTHPHAFHLGISVGRGGTGCHVIHCDVMLQHKHFHTHYSTTGNVTDTSVIQHAPCRSGSQEVYDLMDVLQEDRYLAHTRQCSEVDSTLNSICICCAPSCVKQVDANWPNYVHMHILPHSYMLSAE